jgi:hypothetical protein
MRTMVFLNGYCINYMSNYVHYVYVYNITRCYFGYSMIYAYEKNTDQIIQVKSLGFTDLS